MTSSADLPGTIGSLLGRCLVALGARRAFASVANVGPVGSSGPVRTDLGLDLHAVGDPVLAALLAAADGRIGPGPGVAVLDGQRVLLTSAPGVAAEVITVSDPAHLPGALAGWTLGLVHAAVEYVLDLDLDAPAPPGLEPMVLDETAGELLTLSPTLADFRLLILAGPGVVRSGHVAGLQALAAHTGAGVANTWGAKGVFPWDDPHHFGTVGMQARDFELVGFDDAELVIASGVDQLESPTDRWAGSAQVLEVEPWQLSSLALRWPEPAAVPEPPPLYRLLSGALAGRYTSDDVPLAPARAASDLSATLPAGGLVAADAGPAGLWVARAFPTLVPGSVIVPAARQPGFAVATTLAAALRGRRAIAVVTDPVDPLTEAVCDLARAWTQPLVVEVWGGDGPLARAADHTDLVRDALTRSSEDRSVVRIDLPVELSDTRLLVEIAGEVVAWGA
ncbi:MAG: hypothetical protein ACXWBN_10780 [Acidimicrobiales bacterium]